MSEEVTKEMTKRLHALDGGGETGERSPRRHAEPTQKLDLQLDFDSPYGDYESFRAELDAVMDPSPKDWWAWAARTDRHIRRGALEHDQTP